MVTSKNVSRNFPTWTMVNGREKEGTMTCNYTLWFEEGKLVEIRNEFNFTCERNSDTWEHFSKLF